MAKSVNVLVISTNGLALDIIHTVNATRSFRVAAAVVSRAEVESCHGRIRAFHASESWESELDTIGSPDLMICAGYPRKISVDTLGRFTMGAFNIHPSLLPKHKGKRPDLSTFEEQPSALGVTIHRMTDAIDSGPVVLQTMAAIRRPFTLSELAQVNRQLSVSLLNCFLAFVGEGLLCKHAANPG